MLMLRAALVCLALAPAAAPAQDAGTLLARHTALQKQLSDNPFGRPLHVASTVSGGAHKGEVHAVIDVPYGVVGAALARPGHWCDILTLQVNVKSCKASDDTIDRKSTRLNSSHLVISYAVFCL